MGTHIETLSPQTLVVFLKATWGTNFAYSWVTMFAKLSVLIFYRRVMGHHTWFKWAADCMIVFILLIGIGSEAILFSHCRPFAYYWNRTIPNGYCWNLELFYFVNAGVNIVADVVITFLPLPLLSQLELPKRQKIGLCVIFSLGGLACAISAVRVFQLPALNHTKDITWDITSAMLWYFVEAHLIIIAACGPALQPFFRRYLP
ncbi:unnamed protein product, partial [Tuber aestivum]